jgi:hypothetical protein
VSLAPKKYSGEDRFPFIEVLFWAGFTVLFMIKKGFGREFCCHMNALCDVSDVVLRDSSNELLDSPRQACSRNRYVWGTVAVVLLVAIVVALAVTLSKAEYKGFPPSETSKTQNSLIG